MPPRSTQITIENHTSQDLHGGHGSLVHGAWSENVPDTIPKGQSGTMRAESDGIMSGDEGRVFYTSAAGDLQFHFDNPFVGDNSYDTSVPDHFSISSSGGEGNNCIITYTVTEKLGHGHK
ncbi:crystal et79 [Fusarium denticulatum]|uniref:Crystal et79 n=1 Tax=Fusarium denticulatum TaxID=48507 RepID=A0A8H5X612_9HYPO|nr:crystal et79 [Fusarium denticulatum]